jgi:hypothetical protein
MHAFDCSRTCCRVCSLAVLYVIHYLTYPISQHGQHVLSWAVVAHDYLETDLGGDPASL